MKFCHLKGNRGYLLIWNFRMVVYENIKIPVPSLPVQIKLVDEIQIFEAQIATTQNTIDNAPAQKQAILKKWLE